MGKPKNQANDFYKKQADYFKEYLKEFPDRDLLSLFDEWAEGKDFSDKDKEGIFKESLSLLPKKSSILLPQLNVHLKSDPIALRDIVKIILLAIELGEENELDNQ
jgi:hypothetical protein